MAQWLSGIDFSISSPVEVEKEKKVVNGVTFVKGKNKIDPAENIVLSAITKMELMVGALNKTDLSKINKNLDPVFIALINMKLH